MHLLVYVSLSKWGKCIMTGIDLVPLGQNARGFPVNFTPPDVSKWPEMPGMTPDNQNDEMTRGNGN